MFCFRADPTSDTMNHGSHPTPSPWLVVRLCSVFVRLSEKSAYSEWWGVLTMRGYSRAAMAGIAWHERSSARRVVEVSCLGENASATALI